MNPLSNSWLGPVRLWIRERNCFPPYCFVWTTVRYTVRFWIIQGSNIQELTVHSRGWHTHKMASIFCAWEITKQLCRGTGVQASDPCVCGSCPWNSSGMGEDEANWPWRSCSSLIVLTGHISGDTISGWHSASCYNISSWDLSFCHNNWKQY